MTISGDDPAPDERRRRLSRGVIVVPGAFGDAFAASFHNVAYVTPRYPDGIRKSDLTQADQIIQRETALWWFLENLEPHDLSKGGPYFGFAQANVGATNSAATGSVPTNRRRRNVVGFNQGAFAPFPLQARDVLEEEFGRVFAGDTISEISALLVGRWMWKPMLGALSRAEPATPTEALAALILVIRELTEAIEGLNLQSNYGSIGHNNPPDDDRLTDQDRDAIIAELTDVCLAAESGADDAPSKIAAIWYEIKPRLVAVSLFILKRVDQIITGAIGGAIGACISGKSFNINALTLEADHIIRILLSFT